MISLNKASRSWGVVCGLTVAGMLLAGCKSASKEEHFADVPGITPPPPAKQSAPASSRPAAPPAVTPVKNPMLQPASAKDPDLIHTGDSLSVVYLDLPQPTPPFEGQVRQDGTLTLLLNQTFVATGKTRGELESEIRERYVTNYFRYMTVSVLLKDRFYYVGGEVKAPGRQIYMGPMTVLKAIQSCGDFTDYAKKTQVELTRHDGRVVSVNCKKARKDPRLDLAVYPGDKINVPRSFW